MEYNARRPESFAAKITSCSRKDYFAVGLMLIFINLVLECKHSNKKIMEKENFLFKKIRIPEWELVFQADRASGPGGQNVNKTATKVTLRFNISNSKNLNEEQKKIILKKLDNWINKKGEIIIAEQSSRSQWTNRQTAIKKLNDLIQEALVPEKERKETKIPEKEKEKRLVEKKIRSRIKTIRREKII